MARRHKWLVVVDDTPEVRCALRFASRRARNVGGRLALLRVVAPPEALGESNWRAIADAMRDEAEDAARHLLADLAEQVQKETGLVPELIVREGAARDQLLRLIDEDEEIRILVLAAAPGSDGPGPLVTALAGQAAGSLRIPVTVVPGSLTNEQIDELT